MSKIEWTNETWNPIIGCSEISTGCKECYAKKIALRLMHMPFTYYYQFVLKDNGESDPEKYCNLPEWNGQTHFQKSQLKKPLHLKKPRMIFVVSMGDLFHETVSFEHINEIFNVISQTPQHTYQILTKRPARMLEFFKWFGTLIKERGFDSIPSQSDNPLHYYSPLKNLWLGVTAENQEQANKRIPILLDIPAAVHFISVEPMLSEIDLTDYYFPYRLIKNVPVESRTKIIDLLDWVICGGESGSKARPMHPDWARSLRDQCNKADVPFFFKQWGEWVSHCQVQHELRNVLVISDKYKFKNLIVNGLPKDVLHKVGKKKAGRLLDRKEHNEMPTNH